MTTTRTPGGRQKDLRKTASPLEQVGFGLMTGTADAGRDFLDLLGKVDEMRKRSPKQ